MHVTLAAAAACAVASPAAAQLSPACQAVNNGEIDAGSREGNAPSTLNGTYSYGAGGGQLSAANWLRFDRTFNVGEVITYSWTRNAGTGYVQLALINGVDFTYDGLVPNATANSGSGTFTITNVNDQLNVGITNYYIDYNGNGSQAGEPARNNTSVNFSFSCGTSAPSPTLGVTMTHTGSGTQGGNLTYTITPSTTGATTTTATVTAAITLPTGITYVTASGTGWSCSGSGTSGSCTRTTPFGTGSGPPITLNVKFDANAGTPLTPSVSLSGGGAGNIATATDPTTVQSLPTITALSPTGGSTAGGTSVIITGTNFGGTTGITFGGTATATFTVNSATQITASAPSHTAGLVNVIVTNAAGSSAITAASQYTYAAPPTTPTVTTPANGATVTTTTPTYAGTAQVSQTITVYVDGASIGTTTSDGTGNWSRAQPTALSNGSHSFYATATNTQGLVSGNSSTNTFTVAPPPVLGSFTASAVAYGSTGNSINAATGTGATNSPTAWLISKDGASFAASAQSANASSVNASITNAGIVTYAAPAGYRGSDRFYVRASNAGGNSNVATVTVTVSNPALASTLTGSATQGSALTGVAISTTGGTAPYSCAPTLASGALPPGTALGADCTITGTPSAAGTYNFTATVTDSSSTPYSQTTGTLTLNVTSPSLTLSPTSPPQPVVGTPYSLTVTASGGNAPYSYAITAGALPAGLTLSSGGALTGTPTAAGAFNVTITATDSTAAGNGGPFTVTRAYSGTVAAPTLAISPATLPNASTGAAYSQTLAVSGGTAPYTFAISAGALPAGLTLTSSGTLAGTPTAGGTFNFTVRVTDSSTGAGAPFSTTRSYTVTVGAPTVTLAPAALPAGTTGAAYSQAFTASGGTPTYSYAVTAGALPAGLTMSSAGTLSGTPTSGGTFNFTVTATDSSTGTGPYSGSRAYSLAIAAASITIAPASLSDRAVGFAFSETISATGGTGPYSYAVVAGALPAGVTLSSGGVLSGTASAGGAYNFTVQVTDGSTGTGPYTATRSYTLNIGAAAITVSPNALPALTAGAAYSQTITASGGAAPYSFAVTAGVLPAGLTLTSAGVLSGTPTTGGPYGFSITATDSSGGTGPYSGTRSFSGTVGSATIAITPASLPAATVAASYSQSLSAAGGTAPYTYAVTAGALPAGLSLAGDGTLSGTPTAGGSFGFTVTATDSSGGAGPFSGSRAYTLTVSGGTVTVSPATLPGAATGTAYSQTITASGGTGGYSFAVTAGALPAGITLAANGTLSGTPTAGGTYNFTVTATDSSSGSGPYTGSRAYSITVGAAALTVSPATLPAGQQDAAYSATFTTSGGTAPYSYAVTAGALPPGLTLTTAGVLSGTPTGNGSYTFTVTATDSSGGAGPYTGARSFTVTIATPAAPVAGNVQAQAAFNADTTINPSLSGRATSLTIANPPQHGTVVVNGLAFTYTPNLGYSGPDSFTYTATNEGGTSSPATVSITVGNPPAPVVSDRSGVAVAYESPGTAIDLSGSVSGASTGLQIVTAPAHGAVTVQGEVVTYTPSAGYSGADRFTFAATGPGGTSNSGTVTLDVAAPPPPAAEPDSASVAGSVAADSKVAIDLSTLVSGEVTSIEIDTQPAHGTVTLSAPAPSGRLAKAGVLAASTVPQVTAIYTPDAGYTGQDSFTFVAVGPGGRSAPATVTITVTGSRPAAASRNVTIRDGQKMSIELTEGATEGPFTAANILAIAPADAATAAVVASGEGAGRRYRLDITPAARVSGSVVITYTLANATGTSDPATVTVTVIARPDPTADRAVRAISDAQAESTRRFARGQVANFMRRTEQLHARGGGTAPRMGITLNARDGSLLRQRPAFDTDSMALADSKRDVVGGRSVRRTGTGINSGAGVLGAAPTVAGEDAGGGPRRIGSVAIWSGGAIDIGTRDATTRREKITATTAGLSAGADMKLAEGVTVGIGGGYGHDLSNIAGGQARITADSSLVAGYASLSPLGSSFVDAMIGHGELDFRSRRGVAETGAVATGARDGSYTIGALAFGIDQLGDTLRWSLYGRGEYMRASLGSYVETGAALYDLRFDRRTLKSVTGTLGARIEYQQAMTFGLAIPRLRVEWNHEFQNASTQRLDYADIAGPAFYAIGTDGWTREQLQVSIGARFLLPDLWAVDVDTGYRGGTGERAGTLRLQLSKEF